MKMNEPNKLTIEISLHPTASKLTANCVEFECLAIAGDLHSLLEALRAQIDNRIFDSYESGELNPTPFIKQLYGDEDSENWVSTKTEIITQPFKKIPRLRQISPNEGCVIIYSHLLILDRRDEILPPKGKVRVSFSPKLSPRLFASTPCPL